MFRLMFKVVSYLFCLSVAGNEPGRIEDGDCEEEEDAPFVSVWYSILVSGRKM